MREAFDHFIRSLELRHFEPEEFLIGLDEGNCICPAYLWPNLALTAVLVDNLRHHFRRPVTITSAYRAPLYNKSVGGVPRSQHCSFSALDVKARGVSPGKAAEWLRAQRGELVRLPIRARRVAYVSPAGEVPFAELETWKLKGGQASMVRAKISIGTYDSFTHCDVRGKNVSWNGH